MHHGSLRTLSSVALPFIDHNPAPEYDELLDMPQQQQQQQHRVRHGRSTSFPQLQSPLDAIDRLYDCLSVCPYVCLSVPLSVCLPLWLVSIKLWFCLPCNTVATLFAISPNRRRETEIHRERVQEIFKRDAFSINGYRLDCCSSYSCTAPSAFRSTDD